MPPAVEPRSRTSPNVLLAAVVTRVVRLSPGFVRVTITGPDLGVFAPYGPD